MISILLNVLRFALEPKIWSVLMNIQLLESYLHAFVVGSQLHQLMLHQFDCMFNSYILVDFLSIYSINSWEKNIKAVTVGFSNSPFSTICFFFMCFETVASYMHRLGSALWIDTFIAVWCLSLSLVTFIVLKFTLSVINVAILALFALVFVWSTLSIFFNLPIPLYLFLSQDLLN